MRRTLLWLAVAPFGAGGVLFAHALAYRLTGTRSEDGHAYLAHAPQLLTVLVLASLLAAAVVGRMARPSAWPLPVAALGAFVLQEHLEGLAHTGQLPWLWTTPVFLLGLVLQIPIALLAWLVARWLVGLVGGDVVRRTRALPRLACSVAIPADALLMRPCHLALGSRAPPARTSSA